MQNNYKMVIAYEGTRYCGWQKQPNAKSIQEEIEKALFVLFKVQIRVVGAGRTDTGVHALGQACHFAIEKTFDSKVVLKSLNGILPSAITIKSLENVDEDFHARFSVKRKIYHYHLWLERFQDPFQRLYSHHVRKKIDLDLLARASKLFIGEHDFTSFSNSSDEGACKKNPVRTIDRLDVVSQRGGVRLEFEGKSFLYKMVRNIVGTLLDVACGKKDILEIERIFKSKDRKEASKASPALGLFLVSIDY